MCVYDPRGVFNLSGCIFAILSYPILSQVLVTTDACSEGIDVPECNLVISMDRIKCSRSLIHTRGRARSKGGKFVIMVEVMGFIP